MKRPRPTIDTRPGVVPNILTSDTSVTFVMAPARMQGVGRLLIRCDDAGEIWVSLEGDEQPSR